MNKCFFWIGLSILVSGCLPFSKIQSEISGGDIFIGEERLKLLIIGMVSPDGTVQKFDWKPIIKNTDCLNVLNTYNDEVDYKLRTNFLNSESQLLDFHWQNEISKVLGVKGLIYFSLESVEERNSLPFTFEVQNHPNTFAEDIKAIKVKLILSIYNIKTRTTAQKYFVNTLLMPIHLPIAGVDFNSAINLGTSERAIKKALNKAFNEYKKSMVCGI